MEKRGILCAHPFLFPAYAVVRAARAGDVRRSHHRAGGRDRNDGTTDKYQQYYAGRRVDFRIDEEGVWMKLSDQKNEAHSSFNQIYSLCETDKCFYFIIKGKAYYIISKEAVSGGTPEELASYMQSHCQKKFLHYKV